MYGKGVAQDKARAVAYYRLAAEQGEPNAQNSLGCCFFDGNGVEQNYEEGMKYFLLSAQQGNPDAIYNLGYNYYYGEGVARDYDKALEYFNTAAEMNHPSAFFLIGECCYEGNGVEKDVKIAKEWFRRALDAGYEPDEEDRALLEDVFGEGLSRQRIIEEMVVDYGSYGQAADEHVRTLLNNLRSADADAADRWDSIMTLWQTVNADLTIHENVLPDGLPNTDELCIVALGFQLNADGTMRDELIERLKVVLNSAEKYPNALIVCTGGGTAAENEASTEAGKMAEWLIANGIPEERIIIDTPSKDHTFLPLLHDLPGRQEEQGKGRRLDAAARGGRRCPDDHQDDHDQHRRRPELVQIERVETRRARGHGLEEACKPLLRQRQRRQGLRIARFQELDETGP